MQEVQTTRHRTHLSETKKYLYAFTDLAPRLQPPRNELDKSKSWLQVKRRHDVIVAGAADADAAVALPPDLKTCHDEFAPL